MFTLNYKGFFIQGYVTSDQCSITGVTGKPFKSMLAAKQYITKPLVNKG